jgi:RNA polymerase sigma-70 factor (ECF subfamily)
MTFYTASPADPTDIAGCADAQEAAASLARRRVAQAVARAQGGEIEAIGFLYVRYADEIHTYVRSIIHDSHEAEDVTQQVFAKMIRAIASYEEREVPFVAWLMRVARNQALDHIRRYRLVPVEEVLGAAACSDPAGGERMLDLREALAELPIDQREVIVLRHLAGLSPPEIALLTGRSESSIHGLHHRGRRALRAELIRRGAAPATAIAS